MFYRKRKAAALASNTSRNFTHISLKGILFMIFGIYIVYATDSLVIATNQNKELLPLSQYFIIAITIVFIFRYFMKSLKITSEMLGLFGVIFTLILSMIVNTDISGGYFLKISVLLFGFFSGYFIEQKKFIAFYIKLMRVIAVVSLIAYIFAQIITNIPFLPIINNTVGMSFTSLFFTNIPNVSLFQIRNYGPFWEPGVYQAYLFVALFFVLFCQNQVRKIDISIFSVTVITTFSTTGILALVTLLFGYIINRQPNNKKSIKWLVCMIAVLVALYTFFNDEAGSMLFNKIQLGLDSPSFSSRWYAIWADITIFLKNPLFGVGPIRMIQEQTLYLTMKTQADSFFNTNTLLMHFAIYGITLGCYYIVLIYKFIRKYVQGSLSILIILMGFFMIFSGESFVYSLFFNTIIFFGLRQRSKTILVKDSIKN